jgi:hypothetical protein
MELLLAIANCPQAYGLTLVTSPKEASGIHR